METLKFPDSRLQKPPDHLQSPGRSLWSSTLREWSLSDAELKVLCTCCEVTDRLAEIRLQIADDGIVEVDPSGRRRSNPLLAAEAQFHGILLRGMKQLNLTDVTRPKIGRPSTR